MDIQNFIDEFKKTFVYDILSKTLSDDQLFEHVVDGDAVLWFKEQTRQIWLMWETAKAQAVPEDFAIHDVISERKRQINQEHYSTEHDDEYQNNELVRAAACYTNNVVSRSWIYKDVDPENYQSEEVPNFWPWDLDFWKPKSPRQDLVRAAALLIAEIERIDRAQEQGHDRCLPSL